MARNEARIVLSAEDRASRVLGNVRQELVGLQGAGGRLASVLGPLGGLAATATALGAGGLLAVKNFASGLDDLAEAADGLGVGAVALAEMRSKAAEAGVESGVLDNALGKLNSRIADAAGGNKAAAATFKAMGVEIRDANGQVRGTEDILREVSERFRGYANTAERGALAADLFGERAGRKLVAYLSQGADGLRQFTGVTEESVAEAQRFQAQVDLLSTALERLRNQALTPLLTGANWLIGIAIQTRTAADRVADLEREVAQLERTLARPDAGGALFEGARIRIAQAREELARFRLEAALDARRLLFGDTGYGPRRERAPVPDKEAADGKAKVSAAEQFLKRLKEQAVAANYTAEEVLRIEAAQLGVAAAAEPWIASLRAGKAAAADLAAQLGAVAEREAARNAEWDRRRQAWEEQIESARRLAQAGESASDTLARELAQIEALADAGAFLAAAGQDAAKAWTMYGNAVDAAFERHRQLTPEVEKASDAARALGFTFSSAFEDAIVGGQRFSQVLQGLGDDILRILARTFITAPLASGLQGLFAGLFPGRAAGGPVSGGRAYVVGERGPELFVPREAGRILPNGEGGALAVSVNVVNNGQPVQARAQQRQVPGGVMIDLILDEVAADIGRGGRVGRAAQVRYGLNPAAGLAR